MRDATLTPEQARDITTLMRKGEFNRAEATAIVLSRGNATGRFAVTGHVSDIGKRVHVIRATDSSAAWERFWPRLQPPRGHPPRDARAMRLDAAEAAANAIIGLLVSWVVTYWLTGFTAAQAAGFTALFFVISFARSFAIRRVFRWLA